MTTAGSVPGTRPYWHTNATWAIGIMAFLSIGASLLLAALANAHGLPNGLPPIVVLTINDSLRRAVISPHFY